MKKIQRMFRPWGEWECFHAGMFKTIFEGKNSDECKRMYADFLGDSERFSSALDRVISEWPISCEQFLSNDGINRIAWLGQASMCIETGVPAHFRGGFKLLSVAKQAEANSLAAACLTRWLSRTEELQSTSKDGARKDTQMGFQMKFQMI